jgi:sec-independent protein translocase protein TatA
MIIECIHCPAVKTIQYATKRERILMLGNLTGWHLLIILAVILLLFGATRLPALSRAVGQSVKIFRSETKSAKDDAVTSESSEAKPTASVPSSSDSLPKI